MRVAWIGAGKMGLPMAGHIARKGFPVVVIDPAEAARVAVGAVGLRIAESVDVGVQDADVIFSSLPDDSALIAVATTVASVAAEGKIFVDTSTVSLAASARSASLLSAAGLAYVRVSVSGNSAMADRAALMLMASGPFCAYTRIEPLLSCLGSARFYLGDAEQARLMKLVVNLMIAVTSGMLAEALVLGSKGGLAWHQMWDVIADSAVASPIVKAKASALRQCDYVATFTVEQMRKDVGLILDAGSDLDVPMSLVGHVDQMLRAASAQGDGALDYAAIIRVAERASGLPV